LLWFENKDNQTKHLKIAKTKSFCFLSNERTATTTSTKTKDVNQFLSFLGTDRGKIPIELNYPSKIINALNSIVPEKSTSIISSITINIFACIFSKQTSKNVLVVNSSLLRLFENQSNSNKSNNSITSTSSWLLRLKKSKHHRVSSGGNGGNGGNGEVVAFASHSLCKQKETIKQKNPVVCSHRGCNTTTMKYGFKARSVTIPKQVQQVALQKKHELLGILLRNDETLLKSKKQTPFVFDPKKFWKTPFDQD
jgi:hypothetical protein